jgi:hypothetical protein
LDALVDWSSYFKKKKKKGLRLIISRLAWWAAGNTLAAENAIFHAD